VSRRPLLFESSPRLIYGHDLIVAGAAMTAALIGRFAFEDKAIPGMLLPAAVLTYALVCAVVFPAFGLHRGIWRYTAVRDIWRVFLAVAIANLLTLAALFLENRAEEFPRSIPVIATLLTTAALCFGRVLATVLASGVHPLRWGWEDRSRPASVIVGDPEMVSEYLTGTRAKLARAAPVAGMVTLGPARNGRTVRGVPLLGDIRNLAAILKAVAARDGKAPQVVVADPRPSRAVLDTVVTAAGEAGSTIARARPTTGGAHQLSPVQAADLLARPPRKLDPDRARRLINGRRVLVTGAGGTIGGELTRQAARLGPSHLTLVDASEFNLYAIDAQLREERLPVPWTAALGDIRDPARLREIFDAERPDVVLHAAALKHVPLMETHPTEAVLTNVAGAIYVMQLARERCQAFVFISTDKAVNPTNVMGATKRVAERAVRALAAGGQARTAVVRFGNVLSSAGSVVPLFERQIAHGGPVTITDPEMVRWFMTVQEAAALVLEAAALPETTEADAVFVLDMGDPVRIDDLARQLIRLHGLQPERDIEIRYTGLRPGEKLSEEIFYEAESVQPTAADGVLAALDPAPEWAELEPQLRELINAAERHDEAAVLDALRRLEPAFRPA
jgi:O-antigen biosynthesis protein WbqV